jgi:hypothetical protein
LLLCVRRSAKRVFQHYRPLAAVDLRAANGSNAATPDIVIGTAWVSDRPKAEVPALAAKQSFN